MPLSLGLLRKYARAKLLEADAQVVVLKYTVVYSGHVILITLVQLWAYRGTNLISENKRIYD
jgi:hypothetical protein